MIYASKRTAEFHYAIRDIVAAAEALERKGREVIHLNIGDPQAFGFRPPLSVIEPVERALRDQFTGYAHSAGLYEARDAVARYALGLGADTTPADVIMTNGASEAADLILTALLNPGDEVLLPAPGYPLYAAILSKLDAAAVYYHLDPENNWQPSVDELTSLISERTRAIVLVNPNNPAGSILDDGITRQILEFAEAFGLLVITDEVYRDLCFETSPAPASVLAEGLNLPVITLESLSKTHMLSGWRVGWMRFTNAALMTELISAIGKLASGRLCSPTPAQYAVKPALEVDRESIAQFNEIIRVRRDMVVSMIGTIPNLSCTSPQSAFYAMIRVADSESTTDTEIVLEMLEKTGVLVVPGSGFGMRPSDGYFRLVYLADEAVLRQSLERIASYAAEKAANEISIAR